MIAQEICHPRSAQKTFLKDLILPAKCTNNLYRMAPLWCYGKFSWHLAIFSIYPCLLSYHVGGLKRRRHYYTMERWTEELRKIFTERLIRDSLKSTQHNNEITFY